MRNYNQRRSAAALTDKQRVFETSTLIDDSAGQRLCVECRAPIIYAHGLCRNCYTQRFSFWTVSASNANAIASTAEGRAYTPAGFAKTATRGTIGAITG
jgi:hypothetical protein